MILVTACLVALVTLCPSPSTADPAAPQPQPPMLESPDTQAFWSSMFGGYQGYLDSLHHDDHGNVHRLHHEGHDDEDDDDLAEGDKCTNKDDCAPGQCCHKVFKYSLHGYCRTASKVYDDWMCNPSKCESDSDCPGRQECVKKAHDEVGECQLHIGKPKGSHCLKDIDCEKDLTCTSHICHAALVECSPGKPCKGDQCCKWTDGNVGECADSDAGNGNGNSNTCRKNNFCRHDYQCGDNEVCFIAAQNGWGVCVQDECSPDDPCKPSTLSGLNLCCAHNYGDTGTCKPLGNNFCAMKSQGPFKCTTAARDGDDFSCAAVCNGVDSSGCGDEDHVMCNFQEVCATDAFCTNTAQCPPGQRCERTDTYNKWGKCLKDTCGPDSKCENDRCCTYSGSGSHTCSSRDDDTDTCAQTNYCVTNDDCAQWHNCEREDGEWGNCVRYQCNAQMPCESDRCCEYDDQSLTTGHCVNEDINTDTCAQTDFCDLNNGNTDCLTDYGCYPRGVGKWGECKKKKCGPGDACGTGRCCQADGTDIGSCIEQDQNSNQCAQQDFCTKNADCEFNHVCIRPLDSAWGFCEQYQCTPDHKCESDRCCKYNPGETYGVCEDTDAHSDECAQTNFCEDNNDCPSNNACDKPDPNAWGQCKQVSCGPENHCETARCCEFATKQCKDEDTDTADCAQADFCDNGLTDGCPANLSNRCFKRDGASDWGNNWGGCTNE